MRLMVIARIALTLSLVLSGGVARAVDASTDVSIGRAETLIKACELEPARQLAQQRLKTQPADAETLSTLGYLNFIGGDAAGAVEALEKSTAAQPNSAQAQFRLGMALAAQVNNVGILSKMGVAKRMRDALARAAELEPKSIEYRTAVLQFYAAAPRIAGGDMDKANAQAAAIAALDPVEGIFAHAFIAFGDSRKKDAEKLMEQAAAQGHAQAQRVLVGAFYVEAKRWDDAFAALDALLKKNPGDTQTLSIVGLVTAKSGQHLDRGEAAIKDFLKNPHSVCENGGSVALAYAHFNLGTIYQKTPRKEEARKEFQIALKLHPDLKDAKKALDAL